MPRGRHYYDPELQTTRLVEGEKDLSRIELYPEGSLDDPNPKWRARRVRADGIVDAVMPGDFDRDRALLQAANGEWSDAPVYELRNQDEDSTWEGHGPSPRIWQNAITNTSSIMSPQILETALPPEVDTITGIPGDSPSAPDEQVQLRVLPITEPGNYVLWGDLMGYVCTQLELWASGYEEDKNPSAAMALRDAADALKDVG
jgi:hypothetical protein